jgi:two-component sensor histidine kinase
MYQRWRERLLQWWQWGLRPGSPAAFGFALLCVVLASGLHILFRLARPDLAVYSTYYPAVLFATLVGGVWSGFLALSLGGAAAWFLFKPTFLLVQPPVSDELAGLLLYILSSLLIIWGAEHYRQAVRRLDEEQHYRRLVVGELRHRIKNKFATVYAVLGHEMRAHADVWKRVSGRLKALANADELICKSDEEGAAIGDVLASELSAYDISRVTMTGDPLLLPPKLAVTFALVIHELATNAAKYGALSTSQGRIAITWTLAGQDLDVQWVETEGPDVIPPSRFGFGTKLLKHALDPFHGGIETKFGRRGIVCNIRCCVESELGGSTYSPSPNATSPAETRSYA